MFRRQREALKVRPEEPKPEQEKQKISVQIPEPMAFDPSRYRDEIVIQSNVSMPVVVKFRPNDDGPEDFLVEIEISVDLKNRYKLPNVTTGKYFEAARIKRNVDGFFDMEIFDDRIQAADRSLEVLDLEEYLALAYLRLLPSLIEEQNEDLYFISEERYSGYTGSYYVTETPARRPYAECSFVFYDDTISVDEFTNEYFKMFSDRSGTFGNSRYSHIDSMWYTGLSKKFYTLLKERFNVNNEALERMHG
jgi:hypothetical protein